jgi:hypothetical protein
MGWDRLSGGERSSAYGRWTDDPEIGGVLGRYLKKGEIRVYIKDTLLKPYTRSRRSDPRSYLKMAGLTTIAEFIETRIKPHGVLLEDGTMLVWANARDWKAALAALHEWSFERVDVARRIVVLEAAAGKFQEAKIRRLVADAARRLDVEPPIWRD